MKFINTSIIFSITLFITLFLMTSLHVYCFLFRSNIINCYVSFLGGKKASATSSGLGSGELAGIVVGVILILIILVVAVMICRKKAHQSKFDRFDNGSVKFSKNGHSNGTLNTEMDERAATAIKPNGAHYT